MPSQSEVRPSVPSFHEAFNAAQDALITAAMAMSRFAPLLPEPADLVERQRLLSVALEELEASHARSTYPTAAFVHDPKLGQLVAPAIEPALQAERSGRPAMARAILAGELAQRGRELAVDARAQFDREMHALHGQPQRQPHPSPPRPVELEPPSVARFDTTLLAEGLALAGTALPPEGGAAASRASLHRRMALAQLARSRGRSMASQAAQHPAQSQAEALALRSAAPSAAYLAALSRLERSQRRPEEVAEGAAVPAGEWQAVGGRAAGQLTHPAVLSPSFYSRSPIGRRPLTPEEEEEEEEQEEAKRRKRIRLEEGERESLWTSLSSSPIFLSSEEENEEEEQRPHGTHARAGHPGFPADYSRLLNETTVSGADDTGEMSTVIDEVTEAANGTTPWEQETLIEHGVEEPTVIEDEEEEMNEMVPWWNQETMIATSPTVIGSEELNEPESSWRVIVHPSHRTPS